MHSYTLLTLEFSLIFLNHPPTPHPLSGWWTPLEYLQLCLAASWPVNKMLLMIKCFYWSASALLLFFSMLGAGRADTDQDRSSPLTPGQTRHPIGGEIITWPHTPLWLAEVTTGFLFRTVLPIQLKLLSKLVGEIRNNLVDVLLRFY